MWPLLLLAVTCVTLPHGQHAITINPLCTEINYTFPFTNLGGDMTILASIDAIALGANSIPVLYKAPDGAGLQFDMYFHQTDNSQVMPNITIYRTIEIKQPRVVLVKTILTHNLDSPWTDMYDVTMFEEAGPGLQIRLADNFVPGTQTAGFSNSGRDSVTLLIAQLSKGSNQRIEYSADAAGTNGIDLPEGKSFYNSTISFTNIAAGTVIQTITTGLCVNRLNNVQNNVLYQHGFTALSFFLALLLGFLIVLLVMAMLLVWCKARCRGCLTVINPDLDPVSAEQGKHLVFDSKAAMKKGFNTIKDLSSWAVDDSIIGLLALKDKMQMFREIDNLDILSTHYVDTGIEKEQNDASIQTTVSLIQSLRVNGDISTQTESKIIANFNGGLKELDESLDRDFKMAVQEVMKKLSIKNKESVGTMMARHEQEKANALLKAKDCTEKEKKDLLNLLNQQQQTEVNDLMYMLALEQNEETENVRKEFAIRKRMGIREQEQNLLDSTCRQGQLNQEKVDWLLKEHAQHQKHLQGLYDDEISRQRMTLEEKLAVRRALAQASETQEDHHVEMLNTMASHQVAAVQKMKGKDVLSAAQAEEYMKKIMSEMSAVKEKMEQEKDRQVAELHKKLSQRKQQQMSEFKHKQKQEVEQYLNNNKTTDQGTTSDPVALAAGLLRLRSNHRVKQSELENQIDGEHFHELEDVRNQIAFTAQADLKKLETALLNNLQEEGMSAGQASKLLAKHDNEMKDLVSRQTDDREKQREKLKQELARRQSEWDREKLQEKQEQEDLREHEAKVVSKLINSQIAISEDERDFIMREHEKQMVKLENSLTLNKLRQKRKLEEKLSQRRAQQMEQLQHEYEKEVQKKRRTAEANNVESDEETHRQEVEIMKKYTERKIAVLQGHELNLEEEMAQVRIDMIKDRAYALKSQEENLGAMIASLQLGKARELAQIEEQQKAINNLKMNLMDDLTDRGILSNPECESIIQRHKEDQDMLNQRLDTQKQKMEKSIQQKLQLRLKQREKSILQQQDDEMSHIGNSTAAKIRRALLKHKQMILLEQFRNQADRERSQVMEAVRRQHEVIQLQALQDQEMKFISGLVKVGSIRQEELLSVLQTLYPHKTSQQLQHILAQIGSEKSQSTQSREGDSTLVQRVEATKFASGLSSRQSSIKSNQANQRRRLSNKRQSQLSLVTSLNVDGERPKHKHSRKNRGSLFEAQGVNTNGGFESDEGPLGYDEVDSRRIPGHRGSNSYENRENYRNSLGGYRHNENHDEEIGYQYPEQPDYIGQGTGHNLGNGGTGPGKLPPLEPHTKKKKKKKKRLLSKLAHREDMIDSEV